MKDITLHLAGPVTVMGPHQQDLTPASMKSRGLLAILGTSHQLRASRAKLQDRLWSDRGQEQGAASLRQALTEIRRSFATYRDALLSGAGWAALDEARVDVDLVPGRQGNPDLVEFAEDLDIRDPEFDDWLREQRQYFAAKWRKSIPEAVATHDLVLVIQPSKATQSDIAALAEMILRDGAARAASFVPATILQGDASADAPPFALELSCHATGIPQMANLQFTLKRRAANQQIWNRTVTGSIQNLGGQFDALTGALTLAILNAGWGPATDDPLAEILSLRDVFSFAENRLQIADGLLAHENDQHSDAIRLALRAYIRNTMLLERFTDDPRETLAEATDLATRALSLAPQNAVILSVASMIACRNRNVDLALDLAGQAEQADPHNPLSRYSLSSALTEAGQDMQAFQEAIKARAGPITALSPATWLMRCAVSAVRAGKMAEALRFSKMAHGYSPNYRPALRFLAALEFQQGNELKTADALQKLHTIEPDFSLALMASDSYPVASLRASDLLGVTKSGLI
ncbi:hypothetical protein [Yoonia sp. 2307UL14-13]|uniref:hypothetical protein n=1 Tax=Yoonia sp. 2307UL14-13 TaxID=3126506 RepID=UPI003098A21D